MKLLAKQDALSVAIGCSDFSVGQSGWRQAIGEPSKSYINRLLSGFTPRERKTVMKLKTNRKRGFTLVEIMIVVAIIGLLAAIAVPNFVKARTTAQQNACINNLRQIDGAVQQWALEQGKKETDTPTEGDVTPYLKNLIVCPAGGKDFASSYELHQVSATPSVTCKQAGIDTGVKQPHALPGTTATPPEGGG